MNMSMMQYEAYMQHIVFWKEIAWYDNDMFIIKNSK